METNNNNSSLSGEGSNSGSGDSVKQEALSTVEMNTEQILTLIDDKQSESFIIPLDRQVISLQDNQGLETRDHSVKDFLSRPMNIGQFTWDSSMNRNDEIFNFSFPSSLFDQPMIAEKISGFNYIKGDIHVRLQINAQNFQAGLFQLRYFPVLSPSDLYNSQLNTMQQFSGLPGIDVNLQSDSPMQIVVPFIYPNDVYDIVAEPDDWAQVYARVYSPLTAASATSVSIIVWAWFDKQTLELSMPCSVSSATVSNSLLKYYTKRVAELQIGGEQQVASKAGGPISSIAGAVNSVASVASGIPGLGAVSGAVGMVSNVVGGIASMFGFSKPTSNQTITQIRPIYARGMANSDFPDSATQVALITDNSLTEAKPIYRTDVDEMSFDFIARIPHFINSFNYATTDNENKLLFSLELNPTIITSTLSSGLITTTSLGLLCSCFELWRGSLNLTFKFAKTQFHSGRLIFVWFNADIGSVPTTYLTEYAKNPAIQLDLHDKFELDLNIPYIQATPWLNIHSVDSTFKRSNGWLGVYVVNTLQAAPSASSTIECVVEARAGRDFEVAIPKTPELLGNFINPEASTLPPSYEYIQLLGGSISGFVNLTVPWNSSTFTLSASTPVTLPVAPSNTFLRIINSVGEIENINVSGEVITLTNEFVIDGMLTVNLLVSSINYPVIIHQAWLDDSEALPYNWIIVYSPAFRHAELQISRDESYKGVDGVSILGSVPEQQVADVNKDTVGEVVKSLRLLLKRYEPDSNHVVSNAFGRSFFFINPDNFSSLGTASASYLSLFFPAYRFWRGSKRYKFVFEIGPPGILYPVYFLPNYNLNTLNFDPAVSSVSTNLHFPDNEGTFEVSVPYYNRNRLTITGDVTNARLLSPLSRRIVIDAINPYTFPQVRLYSNIGEDFTFGMWLGAPTLTATSRT